MNFDFDDEANVFVDVCGHLPVPFLLSTSRRRDFMFIGFFMPEVAIVFGPVNDGGVEAIEVE